MRFSVAAAAILVGWTIGFGAIAQQGSSTQPTADPATNPDQELGRRFFIKPEDLPPPKTGPIAASRSLVITLCGTSAAGDGWL
jgi:hypothetical protein